MRRDVLCCYWSKIKDTHKINKNKMDVVSCLALHFETNKTREGESGEGREGGREEEREGGREGGWVGGANTKEGQDKKQTTDANTMRDKRTNGKAKEEGKTTTRPKQSACSS
jgi:hypothetical protein